MTSAGVLGLAASGRAPALSFFDGGPEAQSYAGAWPDEAVEGDDLALLDRVEARWRSEPDAVWMGWLTYDLGADFVRQRSARRGHLPGFCLRRYPGALAWGPRGRRAFGHANAVADLERALAAPPRGAWPLGRLEAELQPAHYRRRVEDSLRHIAAGDTYQINLSQRMRAAWRVDDPLSRRVAIAYADLRRRAPAPMGALVGHAGGWFASNSPETLLDVAGDVACSWPIKGTRPRGRDAGADAAAGAELLRSAKDAAEHVMIVDLVRSDLGRVAQVGTVTTTARPQLLTLPTVHHLVTPVRARLRRGTTLRELVEAVFPGGSITGAPKRRTVELIDDLEQRPRGIYCGSFVLLEPDGLRMSIAIRTGELTEDGLELRSGGGIVIDSDPEAERLETLAKASAFAGQPAQ